MFVFIKKYGFMKLTQLQKKKHLRERMELFLLISPLSYPSIDGSRL